jgi:hypothetical protein
MSLERLWVSSSPAKLPSVVTVRDGARFAHVVCGRRANDAAGHQKRVVGIEHAHAVDDEEYP